MKKMNLIELSKKEMGVARGGQVLIHGGCNCNCGTNEFWEMYYAFDYTWAGIPI